MRNKYILLLIFMSLNISLSNSQEMPEQQETLKHMLLVNNYFVTKYPDPCQPTFVQTLRPSNIWTRAVYFEGLMALHAVYPLEEFYQYALKWAEFHQWGLDKGAITRHADNQCCGQTYIDLYNICPDDPRKIRDIKLSIDMMVNTPQMMTGGGWMPFRCLCPYLPNWES